MVEQTKNQEPNITVVNEGEKPEVILERCQKHIESWKSLRADQIKITRLSGMSNAVYKVSLIDGRAIEPDTLLYRKFLCEVVDKRVEAAIFESMSDQGLGPKLIFRCDEYRIEGFFHGRPLTIWEARNPLMMKYVAKAIFEFNFNQDAMDRVLALKPINRE